MEGISTDSMHRMKMIQSIFASSTDALEKPCPFSLQPPLMFKGRLFLYQSRLDKRLRDLRSVPPRIQLTSLSITPSKKSGDA